MAKKKETKETRVFTSEQKELIRDVVSEYMKNSQQQKNDGWDEYWCYSRPGSRNIGSLTKIIFKIGKKELFGDDLRDALEKEVIRRLEEGDSYFIGGVRTFACDDAFYNIENDRDYIMNELLDSPELIEQLEKCVEYPKLNEMFQRIRDYQHNLIRSEIKRDFVHSFRKRGY